LENDLAVSAANGSSRMYVKKDAKKHVVSLTAWKNDTEDNVKNGTKRTGSILKITILVNIYFDIQRKVYPKLAT